MDKLIISVAVTGGSYNRDSSPYLPITPDEIADSAVDAYHAGAAIAHIHVRNDDGTPCHDLERYRHVVHSIQSRCDMVMNLTTDLRIEGGLHSLELAPEIASFPCGSTNLGEVALVAPSIRAPRPRPTNAHTADKAGARNLPPRDARNRTAISRGGSAGRAALPSIPARYPRQRARRPRNPPEARRLASRRSAVDGERSRFEWAADGRSRDHARRTRNRGSRRPDPLLTEELATSNAQLVERVVRIAHELGRQVATVDDARRTLGLKAAATAAHPE